MNNDVELIPSQLHIFQPLEYTACEQLIQILNAVSARSIDDTYVCIYVLCVVYKLFFMRTSTMFDVFKKLFHFVWY